MGKINLKEYEICKVRGHKDSGTVTGWENYTEYTCEHCGIHYYYKTPVLVEIKPPKKYEGK